MAKRLKKARKAVGKRIKKRAKNRLTTAEFLLRRIERIEAFLEPDLTEFYEKQKIAADPLAATVGTG